MLHALVAIAVLLQGPPPYPDRAKFVHALNSLPEHATKAQIREALGNPDRISASSEMVFNGKRVLQETWLYGTDGPTGAATLAQITVFDGQLAYHPATVPPPPVSVISEGDLRKGLHIILDSMPAEPAPREPGNATLSAWVVKTANALLPFGEAKCK